MNKSILREQILAQLRADLATQTAAAQLARDEAISEESKAENKYDTHSQEAAYLAEGQARLAAEIREQIEFYAAMTLPALGPRAEVIVGALVEIEEQANRRFYFVGPRAGGLEVTCEEQPVMVVTPQSPLGRQLLGRRAGDAVQLPGRGSRGAMNILSVS